MSATIIPFPVKPKLTEYEATLVEGPGLKAYRSFDLNVENFRAAVVLLTGSELGFSEPETRSEEIDGVERKYLWTEKRYEMDGLRLELEILQAPKGWPDWFTAIWCKGEIYQCQETGQLKLSKWGMERLLNWGDWILYTQGRIDVVTHEEFTENFRADR